MGTAFATAAAWIELLGALVIAWFVLRACAAAWQERSPGAARVLVTEGLVAGLDFKLAATLLKTLDLANWRQIGMALAVFALRVFIKKTMVALSGKAGGPGANGRSSRIG